MIGHSKDTLVANIAQQVSAVVLFLVVPNLLSVEHYAAVVFTSVLVSIARFSDIGMTLVYGRNCTVHDAKRVGRRTLLILGQHA